MFIRDVSSKSLNASPLSVERQCLNIWLAVQVIRSTEQSQANCSVNTNLFYTVIDSLLSQKTTGLSIFSDAAQQCLSLNTSAAHLDSHHEPGKLKGRR